MKIDALDINSTKNTITEVNKQAEKLQTLYDDFIEKSDDIESQINHIKQEYDDIEQNHTKINEYLKHAKEHLSAVEKLQSQAIDHI